MRFDLPNIIVDEIFSDEEIAQIYEHVDNTPKDKQGVVAIFGQTAFHSWLPQNIVDKIVARAQSISDTPIKLRELSFARYSYDSGHKPALIPHTDETFKEPRLTFDIQLKSSRPWAIVVEGVPYTLEDNQALVFAGTHQVHWREKIEFEQDDYMDMIFCHFSADTDEENTLGPDHEALMQSKRDEWFKIYNKESN